MKRLLAAFLLTAICSVLIDFQSLNSATASTLVAVQPTDVADRTIAEEEEEKLTITKIMKLAHKSGLLKKVATGKASDGEKAKLLKYYKAMPELSPPKGTKESWDEKTKALVVAATAAVKNDPSAPSLLKSSTHCAACHDVHK